MTKIPWFRYGLKETKKWLNKMQQSGHPLTGEIVEAKERCIRKMKNIEDFTNKEELSEINNNSKLTSKCSKYSEDQIVQACVSYINAGLANLANGEREPRD